MHHRGQSGRPVFAWAVCGALWFGSQWCGHQRAGADELPARDWPDSFRQDASLFDVCFVNPLLGWAVGDRGTILHTRDGGQTWDLQASTVDCRLEAVHFHDPRHGWAVGGYTVPFTHRALGVLLRTEDGGQTWQREAGHFLPWLRGVHFVDPKNGLAWGSPSAMFPSAVFSSEDGGRHWTGWSGQSAGWVHGVIDERGQGLLLERNGQLRRIGPGELREPVGNTAETRLGLRLAMNPDGPWLLCGNQGLVRQSDDGGKTWLAPRGLPAEDALAEFDWQAVTVIGPECWIAGAPGTQILYSPDAGVTWKLRDTGHHLPLYASEFADPQHGWLVGALGTILATQDGGVTWQHQRGAQRRLAAMAVVGQPEQIPWELVAHLAANEGHLMSLEVLSANPSVRSTMGQTPLATRLHEATVRLGGAGANVIQSLPAPDLRWQMSAGDLRRQWDQATQTNCVAQVTEYLVRQLRMWRPDLVVLTQPEGPGAAVTEVTRQAVLQAIEKAAEEDEYPLQRLAGLSPWRVLRVTSLTDEAATNHYTVTRARLVLPLGRSVGHLADQARANLESSYRAGPEQLSLRQVAGADGSGRNLFAVTAETSATRPAETRRVDRSVDSHRPATSQAAQRRRNLEVLFRNDAWGQPALAQQMIHLASELPEPDGSELLLAAAGQGLSKGQPGVALELLRQIQGEEVQGPQTEAARVQLFWYLASAEATLHWPLALPLESRQVNRVGTVAPAPGEVQAANFDQAGSSANGVQLAGVGPASRHASGASQQAVQHRHEQLQQIVDSIRTQQPDLYFEPLIRLPLAAFQRRTGQLDEAIRYWRSQLSGRTDPAYRSWAAAELALLERDSPPPRPTWTCRRIPRPPRLDGILTDAVWADLPWVSLHPAVVAADAGSAASDNPASDASLTAIRMGHDREYLYLAIRCRKSDAVEYQSSSETRQRDLVATTDRCELFLDTDRDGVTQWRLAIDHRGWAGESLNSDPTWDPTWYIASSRDDTSWTVEAAIPLSELTTEPPMTGTAWCLGIQRIIPTVTWETWMQPAPVEARPEEFGLLIFE